MEEIAKAKAEAEAKKQDLLGQARYACEAEARKAELEARKALKKKPRKRSSGPTLSIGETSATSPCSITNMPHPLLQTDLQFNKDVIGDNINIIIPGQELRIPFFLKLK